MFVPSNDNVIFCTNKSYNKLFFTWNSHFKPNKLQIESLTLRSKGLQFVEATILLTEYSQIQTLPHGEWTNLQTVFYWLCENVALHWGIVNAYNNNFVWMLFFLIIYLRTGLLIYWWPYTSFKFKMWKKVFLDYLF